MICMKKFILALLAVSTFATAEAQKNTILKYGNAGIYRDQSDAGAGNESRTFNWHINPGVGYQFTDHITLGLQGGFWSNFDENRTSPSANQWNRNAMENREWQLGIFYRYTHYFGNIFYVFGQLDLSYVSGQDVSENETRQVDFANNRIAETVIYNYDYYNGFMASYRPMIGMFIHDGFSLNFGFGDIAYRTTSYDVPKSTGNPTIDQSFFAFRFGQQFNFGASLNIKCHKKTGNVKPGDDLRPMMMEEDDDE